MSKIKIQIAILGENQPNLSIDKIKSWKSEIFEIYGVVESFQLNCDAEGDGWEYLDDQISNLIERSAQADFLLIITGVRLQQDWYLRRLSDNRLVMTFHDMNQILSYYGLPQKNLLLRVLYAATLVYKRYKSRIPPASEQTDYAHDETRRCIFDMNSNKTDVVYSLHQPRICEPCRAKLRSNGVSNELIIAAAKELRKVKKPLADRILALVREHPIASIAISLGSALVVGIAGSLIASFIFDVIKRDS